jgi:hypothetical protein
MIVDADQLRVGALEIAASEFIARNPSKCIVEAFVLVNASARHEPEALSGTVGAMAEQVCAVLVRDDQVDRNERRCVDDAQEGIERQHGGEAP